MKATSVEAECLKRSPMPMIWPKKTSRTIDDPLGCPEQVNCQFFPLNPYQMSFLPKNAIKTAPTEKAMFIIHKKFHIFDTGIIQTLFKHYTDISFSFMMIIQDLRNKYLESEKF